MIEIRAARAEDCRNVWAWRNDSETRAASFNGEAIPFDRHEAWFKSRLAGRETRIFIALDARGREVGYVRFNVAGENAEVSVALDAAERGKGVGPAAIRAAVEALLADRAINRVTALVKCSNPSSARAFEKAGFLLQGKRRVGEDEALEWARLR